MRPHASVLTSFVCTVHIYSVFIAYNTCSIKAKVTHKLKCKLGTVTKHNAVKTYDRIDLGTIQLGQLFEALPYNPESRFRFPMVSLEFFIDIILPAALWFWVRLNLEQK
jgi:hypothetical protein